MEIRRASIQRVLCLCKVKALEEPEQHWSHKMDPIEV
jgi:hypothetical protein